MHDTKSGEVLDILKVEKGRLRDLGSINEHNNYEVVKNAVARGGSHVHAKWLQDHKGDEVRCRLLATQLAIGERPDVTQSTPPSMAARLLLSIVSCSRKRAWALVLSEFFGDVPVAFHHAMMEELVYVHPPRGTCPLGIARSSTKLCWYSSRSRACRCEKKKKRHIGQIWCDFRGSSAE